MPNETDDFHNTILMFYGFSEPLPPLIDLTIAIVQVFKERKTIRRKTMMKSFTQGFIALLVARVWNPSSHQLINIFVSFLSTTVHGNESDGTRENKMASGSQYTLRFWSFLCRDPQRRSKTLVDVAVETFKVRTWRTSTFVLKWNEHIVIHFLISADKKEKIDNGRVEQCAECCRCSV